MEYGTLRGPLSALPFFIVFVVGLLPGRAMAYDCDALVVDDAGTLGSDIGRVEAAAQKLENAGAYVRVRTVENFGGFADLDRYEDAHEEACPAWQGMEGGTKSNLLVFAVSFGDKRGAGLYYGDLWKRALDARWNGVLTDEVVPRLRDGDNAAAFVAGLDGIGEIVAASKSARTASANGTAPVVVVQQPSAPSQPVDLSGLWDVMWGMMWGAFVIGVTAAVGWAFASWRRAVDEKREARQKAQLAMRACMDYVTSVEGPFRIAQKKVDDQAANFVEADVLPLREMIAVARRKLAAAQTAFGELQAAGADPDKSGLTAGEYRNLEERYDGLLRGVREAADSVVKIHDKLAELAELAATAERACARARVDIDESAERIRAAESEGFRVEAAKDAQGRAFAAFERGEAAREAKAFVQMRVELKEAGRLAKEAFEHASAIQRGKREFDVDIDESRALSTEADGVLDIAHATFAEISGTYNRACWDHVAGNGSEAERLLEDADVALDAAKAAASMESQDWEAAEERLAAANDGIRRALALATAIIAVKKDIEAARAAAPEEIDAAAADIREARAFVKQHDADIAASSAHMRRLDEAEELVEQAREELAASLPRYVAVVKTVRQANAAADGILAAARNEHQAMERKRERAVTALREAERSVDAASHYVRGHRSDVDSDAERLAESAERALEAARNAGAMDDRIRYGDQADQEADRALDMAKRDVRNKQEEREREARRQREASEAIVRAAAERPRASHSSSSAFGHRSGGSVGFGGSGRRSGGSVGSGGRGGRGGGSVGW